MLIEVKCIHGNDSSKCEKCSIQDSDKMLCIHGNDDSSKCEKCSIQESDKMLCIHGNSSKCENKHDITKENNNKKINDEMLCIREMLLISSYYSTLKNH